MHQPRISHLGPQVPGEGGTPPLPYLTLSRRVTHPPFTRLEPLDGPRRPLRKKLYPSRDVFEAFITDRERFVWRCEVTEEHNVQRVRPGGRDESWSAEEFMGRFQEAFQNPRKNENYIFLFKENRDEAYPSDSIWLVIKERSGKVVINLNNPALLEMCDEELSARIISEALAEENNLFKTFCIKGNLDLMKTFVKNGVSLNAIYDHCWSPLQLTIQYGHVEAAAWLIECGCDMLRVSTDGKYALGMAVEHGHLELLKLMKKAGCPFEEETYENMNIETPMMLAMMHQHKHIVEWMVGPNGYRTIRDAKKFGRRKNKKGPGMFETVSGYYPRVWGVTTGVDENIRDPVYS